MTEIEIRNNDGTTFFITPKDGPVNLTLPNPAPAPKLCSLASVTLWEHKVNRYTSLSEAIAAIHRFGDQGWEVASFTVLATEFLLIEKRRVP